MNGDCEWADLDRLYLERWTVCDAQPSPETISGRGWADGQPRVSYPPEESAKAVFASLNVLASRRGDLRVSVLRAYVM
jgi:hypothetical protein